MSVKCFIKSMNGALKDEERVYAVAATYSRINADEFVNMLERNCGINRAQAYAVLDAAASQLSALLGLGHSVEIPALGTVAMSMKAHVLRDEKGKYRLNEPHFSKLRLLPSPRLKKQLCRTNFLLASAEILHPTKLSRPQMLEIIRKITDETATFMLRDFQLAANISHGYAVKVLREMVEKGEVQMRRVGGVNLYSLP